MNRDLSYDEELDWISSLDNLKFLDGDDMRGSMVALQSFECSGSFLLSRFLEIITGVHTGSDMDLNITLPMQH